VHNISFSIFHIARITTLQEIDFTIPELWGSLVISGRLPSEGRLFSTNKSITYKNCTFHCIHCIQKQNYRIQLISAGTTCSSGRWWIWYHIEQNMMTRYDTIRYRNAV